MTTSTCPKCSSNHSYFDGNIMVCPICFHEWSSQSQETEDEELLIQDANGNALQDGDDVLIIRDLKVGKDTLKQGTKVKNIKILLEPVNGHDIQAKVDKLGPMYLKSSVVKKF